MKKILIVLLLLAYPAIAHAEDVYCGNYNGKPAYVDIDSIEKHSTRTRSWEITDYGIYPVYIDSYSANINADGLWYEVHFNIKKQKTVFALILDKNKKSTHESISVIDFDFAFQVVQENYPEVTRKRNDALRIKREERELKTIEDAKRSYSVAEKGKNTEYVSIPYKDQTKTQLTASLTNIITKYVQAYNVAPEPKNIQPELRAMALEVKTICEFFTKEELIIFAGGNIELKKALLGFK